MELDDDETVALSACDGSLDTQLLELVRLSVCASMYLSVLWLSNSVRRKLNSYLHQVQKVFGELIGDKNAFQSKAYHPCKRWITRTLKIGGHFCH